MNAAAKPIQFSFVYAEVARVNVHRTEMYSPDWYTGTTGTLVQRYKAGAGYRRRAEAVIVPRQSRLGGD
jgi:hypothetical protein